MKYLLVSLCFIAFLVTAFNNNIYAQRTQAYSIEILDIYCDSCEDSGSSAEIYGHVALEATRARGGNAYHRFWRASEASAKASHRNSKIGLNGGIIRINQSRRYEFSREDIRRNRAGVTLDVRISEYDSTSSNDHFRPVRGQRIQVPLNSSGVQSYRLQCGSDNSEQIWVRYRVRRTR